jgi:hypothetical protein
MVRISTYQSALIIYMRLGAYEAWCIRGLVHTRLGLYEAVHIMICAYEARCIQASVHTSLCAYDPYNAFKCCAMDEVSCWKYLVNILICVPGIFLSIYMALFVFAEGIEASF